MSMFSARPARPSRRPLRHAALAAGVLLGGSLAAVNTAHAALACRSDPVVTLSNGIKLNLSASLANDTAADITAITYTLHAPAGTGVTKVVYTSGAVGQREHLVFSADNAAGSYDVNTLVSTVSTGVSVTATTNAVYQGAGSGGTDWDSATGSNGHAIATHVTK